MIFKQIDEILSGQKTQTRRVCKGNEHRTPADGGTVYRLTDVEYDDVGNLWSWDGVIKWEVGRTYAVVPKRGLPAVWWSEDWEDSAHSWLPVYREKQSLFRGMGFEELRIRITAIHQERLQDITEADAQAEGVGSVAEYRELWESINGKTPGARWQDNPMVFVLEFELVRDGA